MSRVVLATRIYAPESAAATFRLGALVEALTHTGVEVEVLTSTPPPTLEIDDAPGPSISRWPVLRDATGYVRGYVPYMSFDVPLALRLLLMVPADAVVVEPPPTTGAVVRAALMLRAAVTGVHTPYVYYAADVWSDASASTGAPDWVVSTVRLLESFALRGAAEVIAVSEGVADRVNALGARNVSVVPNGIDTEVFKPTDPGDTSMAAGRIATPTDTPFFVYAGTASEWQGADVFAQALPAVLEKHPDTRVVFLGQGSSLPELERLQAKLPAGALELRGLVPPDQAAIWQQRAVGALVSVKPGLGYDFAYPTKVLAALACGTPVVFAGPGPAAADVDAHHLGYAVPHDSAAVAGAMIRVLDEWSGRPRSDADPAETPSAQDHQLQALRLRQWVIDHRSLAATGRAATDVVYRVVQARLA